VRVGARPGGHLLHHALGHQAVALIQTLTLTLTPTLSLSLSLSLTLTLTLNLTLNLNLTLIRLEGKYEDKYRTAQRYDEYFTSSNALVPKVF